MSDHFMLYLIITFTYFYAIRSTTYRPPFIEETIIIDCDSGPSLGQGDICLIDCNMAFDPPANAKIIYCGFAETCIVNCSNTNCLYSSTVYGNYSTNLQIKSSAASCMLESKIYSDNITNLNVLATAEESMTWSTFFLPHKGNAIITAQPLTFFDRNMLSGTIYYSSKTENISIQCVDYIGSFQQCELLYIDAKDANYLHVLAVDTDIQGTVIYCPTDSTLSPGCIIDATDADDTRDTFIYSPGGTPADVVFYAGSGSYDGTTIVCNSGESEIDGATNSFDAGICFATTTPTDSPTTATSAPTTDSPTTAYPTSSVPTTSAPTIVFPTSAFPTSASPTTAHPTSSIPTTSTTATTSIPTTSPGTGDQDAHAVAEEHTTPEPDSHTTNVNLLLNTTDNANIWIVLFAGIIVLLAIFILICFLRRKRMTNHLNQINLSDSAVDKVEIDAENTNIITVKSIQVQNINVDDRNASNSDNLYRQTLQPWPVTKSDSDPIGGNISVLPNEGNMGPVATKQMEIDNIINSEESNNESNDSEKMYDKDWKGEGDNECTAGNTPQTLHGV